MKRIIVLTVVTLSGVVSLCAQGLVNFANTPTTLVSVEAVESNGSFSVMSGPPGSYYFELFLGTPGSYTATGIYATNTGVAGLFSGGNNLAVSGWSAGTTQTYWIGGWSANMGHDFNPSWLQGSSGDFGLVGGSGVAGNGSSIPTLNLFDGGGNTITTGFGLSHSPLVPEPSTTTIAAIGTLLMLLRRTKKSLKSP